MVVAPASQSPVITAANRRWVVHAGDIGGIQPGGSVSTSTVVPTGPPSPQVFAQPRSGTDVATRHANEGPRCTTALERSGPLWADAGSHVYQSWLHAGNPSRSAKSIARP